MSRTGRLADAVARRAAAAIGGGASAFAFSGLVFLNEGPVARLSEEGWDAASMGAEFGVVRTGFAYVTLVGL